MAGHDSLPVGFPSTLWTNLHEVRDRDSRRQAMGALVERYWKPVYWFIRLSWKRDAATAMDLTQAFFLDLLESGFVERADPSLGRFRSFLRTRLRRFLTDQSRAEKALRRGGDAFRIPIDDADLDSAEVLAAGRELEPDQVFDREWAAAVVHRAVDQLRTALTARGQAVHFEVFRLYDLEGEDGRQYRDIAAKLGLTEDDVRNRLRIARQEFRGLILQEVRETVGSAGELQDEVRELFAWME